MLTFIFTVKLIQITLHGQKHIQELQKYYFYLDQLSFIEHCKIMNFLHPIFQMEINHFCFMEMLPRITPSTATENPSM